MKLTGWELWLCGAADGPLFAPNAANATAFDSEDVTAEVRRGCGCVYLPWLTDAVTSCRSPRMCDCQSVVNNTLPESGAAPCPVPAARCTCLPRCPL